MSGIVRDAPAEVEGSQSPASDSVPQESQGQGLPSANPENPQLAPAGTATQTEGGIDEVGSPVDEPTGEDGLRREFEERFQADKAELQKVHNQQLQERSRELFETHDRLYAAQQRNRALENKVKELVEQYGGDEGDLALLRVAADEAEQAASRQTSQRRAEANAWMERQEPAHKEFVQQQAVDSQTGQQLFDPEDPDIQQAFETFLPLGYEAMSSGRQSRQAQATQAWQRVLNLIEQKREDGFRRLGSQPTGQRTPEENRELTRERGPMNRGDGTNASVTSDSLMEEAKRRYPGDSRQAFEARYAWWESQRRQHGISG